MSFIYTALVEKLRGFLFFQMRQFQIFNDLELCIDKVVMDDLNFDRAYSWFHWNKLKGSTIQKANNKPTLQFSKTENFLSVSRSVSWELKETRKYGYTKMFLLWNYYRNRAFLTWVICGSLYSSTSSRPRMMSVSMKPRSESDKKAPRLVL